jgi:transcription antitermination factor NusG
MMSKLSAALTDADFRHEATSTVATSGDGHNSLATPQSKKRTDGETVRYAYDEAKRWYVLRCTYSRATQARDVLHECNVEYYMPMYRTIKLIGRKRKKCTVPLLKNLVFIYATEQDADALLKHPHNIMLNYYYDHCTSTENGLNPPLTVGYREMQNFILATGKPRENVKILGREQCRFLSGDRVRVTAGEFVGVEGRVARAAGEQRVVVELQGVCLFATAYVPSAFLQKI